MARAGEHLGARRTAVAAGADVIDLRQTMVKWWQGGVELGDGGARDRTGWTRRDAAARGGRELNDCGGRGGD